jgi:hypothetical protein
MAGPPNLADHANLYSRWRYSSGPLNVAGVQHTHTHTHIYINHYQKWSPAGSTPEPPASTTAFKLCPNQCAKGCCLVHPPLSLFKNDIHPEPRGKACDRTVQSCMDFEIECCHNCRYRGHKNRDKISLGPGSARVRSECGDSHFWVIRCHKSNGDVCFLI